MDSRYPNKSSFQYKPKNNTSIHDQTDSEWIFEGISIAGQLQGKQLNRLPFDQGFWFEWGSISS